MKKLFKRYLFVFLIFNLCCHFEPVLVSKTQATSDKKQPVMSIVIDDFGSYDESGVEILMNAKIPLTCAVLPNVDNTQKHIDLILNSGHELILHMPMQSHVNLPEDWYGPVYIKNSDSPEIAIKKLNECLNSFPNIRGFNIHIGSGVSKNKTLMTAIYNFAKENNLYFLDSRTIETHATEDACQSTNSIYLGRDVFLEADKNRSYGGAKYRLLEGAKLAFEKGFSIVIGHVGAEGGENTAKAIVDTIAEIEKMGVKVVPLSEIYEYLNNLSTKKYRQMPIFLFFIKQLYIHHQLEE